MKCNDCKRTLPKKHFSLLSDLTGIRQSTCIICSRLTGNSFHSEDLKKVTKYREWCKGHWEYESWQIIMGLNRHWNDLEEIQKVKDPIASHRLKLFEVENYE